MFFIILFIYFFYHIKSCELNDTSTGSDNGDEINTENLTWTVWIFFAAQLLHGAGASPLFTLGVTYIDENVSKKMSSVYLGKFFIYFYYLLWCFLKK